MSVMEPYACFVPKHHLAFHLVAKMPLHGNPRLYATWLDESLNKKLKACCRYASQVTFEQTVLVRMAELLKPDRT